MWYTVAMNFKVGARGSKLSRIQTKWAMDFLSAGFPGVRCEFVPVETPGDRDLATPIERSAPDFFTRDLDEAVRSGAIDFAVHSAKDLPDAIADDLDWFWLPCREDPRDCLVFRKGGEKGGVRKVGVSSERRGEYARRRFPSAELAPIRGAIDSRIAQLLDGGFDAVVMAMAGLKRLFPEWFEPGADCPVDMVPIPVEELAPPEAQGALAVVFRAGDARLMDVRAEFVKAVRFVSAGVGDAELVTVKGARDLAAADVVLYDDLLGADVMKTGPVRRGARLVRVGKRCGAHSMKQAEITRLICDEARKGRRVVRLKGGDAGLFGRLAEETDALRALRIPFVVRPGVSALVAATTGTGMLLTKRGESCGFRVYTPRSTGSDEQRVLFMATKVAADEARRMAAGGLSPTTPCAFVWDAASPRERVWRGTLDDVARGRAGAGAEDAPGLFIVGPSAAGAWPRLGPLAGRRVLLTCSEAVMEKAALAVEDRGGRPVPCSLIRLVPTDGLRSALDGLSRYWAVVLTSPSAVRIFFETCRADRRRLPLFFTCGAGTDGELRRYGVSSDVMPARDFSAAGLVAEIARLDLAGRRVLRLRSALAPSAVADALLGAGAEVDDVVLYDNVPTPPPSLPPFDDVFFASASAVRAFVSSFGAAALDGKGVHVMGGPTRAALPAGVPSKVLDVAGAAAGLEAR